MESITKVRQAVIMAAGKSTRTYPLTLTKPKPLLKVSNKTILEHNLDQLNDLVEEIILIVGYKSDMIKKFIGSEYKNLKIKYVEQKQQLGTGHAALQVEKFIDDKFIIINGDDMYCREDIQECITHHYCVLAHKINNPERFGVFVVDYNSNIKNLVEKPKKFISNLANCGLYILDRKIFGILKKLKKSERGEIEITDGILALKESDDIYCVISKKYWFPIGYPWNLLEANERLLKEIRYDIRGAMKNTIIDGNVFIEENSFIEDSKIIGPAVIGKNTNIKNSTIEGSSIGNNLSITNTKINQSILFDSSNISDSEISFSIIGQNNIIKKNTTSFSSKENIKSDIKDSLVDTGRTSLGLITGDNVELIETTTHPGIKVWTNKKLKNSELIKDLK